MIELIVDNIFIGHIMGKAKVKIPKWQKCNQVRIHRGCSHIYSLVFTIKYLINISFLRWCFCALEGVIDLFCRLMDVDLKLLSYTYVSKKIKTGEMNNRWSIRLVVINAIGLKVFDEAKSKVDKHERVMERTCFIAPLSLHSIKNGELTRWKKKQSNNNEHLFSKRLMGIVA